jgi:EAL domain-containing protein (putative c-di-GMP-specific phosphodiesterase class I)
VAHVAEKIRESLATPYELRQTSHHSTPSIGVYVFLGDIDVVDDVIKRADIAMYQAKDSGRNSVRFYNPELQKLVQDRASLESDLLEGIESQQLQLYYQIQVDNELRPFGAEALIRWNHPVRGLVSPVVFIPVAEESTLILDIGYWVLDNACQQISAWSQHKHTCELILAVNVSAKQFRQLDFVEIVKSLIDKHHINPSRLKLELTESVALNDLDFVIAKMQALREVLGVKLSLDDFGTGYSSLSYLKRLPLHQVKIDQSFVRDMVTDASDDLLVKTIIDMAHNFNLDVIAEGVETEAQLTRLGEHGCTSYQGYLFSKPVPVAEFEKLLNESPIQVC